MRTLRLAVPIAVVLTVVGWGPAESNVMIKRGGLRAVSGDPSSSSASANAAAAVVPAISIEKNKDLDFGDVFAGSTPGTVVMSTADQRTPSGGATLGTADGQAAEFNVEGVPGEGYSITLPSGSVILDDGASHTMDVDAFASTPSGNGILSGNGEQVIKVGAILNVGANQAPGQYSGEFDVTVAYN